MYGEVQPSYSWGVSNLDKAEHDVGLGKTKYLGKWVIYAFVSVLFIFYIAYVKLRRNTTSLQLPLCIVRNALLRHVAKMCL